MNMDGEFTVNHEMTVAAKLENLGKVNAFIGQQLEKIQCPLRTITQIEIAVEEIFVNIVHYAYNPSVGEATIRCSIDEERSAVVIQFLDEGVPYNPLQRADPDITLGADQRGIGGLGIFMTKKNMDEVSYSYENGKNVLMICKRIGGGE